jgi:MSHA pilin protein MshC
MLSEPSIMRNAGGFTLVELLVILIVLGILAVFLLPNMRNLGTFQARGEYDDIVSALQYARKSAIAKRRYVCVTPATSGLTLTIDANPPESTATAFGGTCPFANPLPLPAPDSACGATNQTCLKATSIQSPVPAAFQFDALGRTAANVTLTVTGFPVVTVEGETGHVH